MPDSLRGANRPVIRKLILALPISSLSVSTSPGDRCSSAAADAGRAAGISSETGGARAVCGRGCLAGGRRRWPMAGHEDGVARDAIQRGGLEQRRVPLARAGRPGGQRAGHQVQRVGPRPRPEPERHPAERMPDRRPQRARRRRRLAITHRAGDRQRGAGRDRQVVAYREREPLANEHGQRRSDGGRDQRGQSRGREHDPVCRHTACRQRPPRLDHDCKDFVPEPATATLRA